MTTGLFITFDQLPLAVTTSVLAIVLVSVFSITSADSGTFVLASMSTKGKQNPGVPIKLIFATAISAFSSVTLLAGGLDALRNLPVAIAAPFTLVLVAICYFLYRSLATEGTPSRTLDGWSGNKPEPQLEAAGSQVRRNVQRDRRDRRA